MLLALLGTLGDAVLTAWSTELLWKLTEEADVQKAVMEAPGVLQRLVDILDANEDNRDLLDSATSVLKNLTAVPANRKTIAAVPGCLERLVSVMEVVWAPQVQASVLADLADDMAVGRAIASVPGALAGLLEILDVEIHEDAYAARALKSLAADSETARAIKAQPGSLQKLENFCRIQWSKYQENRSGSTKQLWADLQYCLWLRLPDPSNQTGVAAGAEARKSTSRLAAEAPFGATTVSGANASNEPCSAGRTPAGAACFTHPVRRTPEPAPGADVSKVRVTSLHSWSRASPFQ
ncbi:hypothetical protein KFL_009400050 [Klebsormidium nitens]|uniref:Vacuolar protein 8 n=1 Tax=Klebsormidium nitens TaxID=105231 RepID=A0A1Y1INE0_KLENI|nr:hypothetical protein KFL_009400050 [Klebsormidium nitens]|eukprot:GAQ92183.1 hypothetical protein KFL_009400050 [Klebsormidium nitens]